LRNRSESFCEVLRVRVAAKSFLPASASDAHPNVANSAAATQLARIEYSQKSEQRTW